LVIANPQTWHRGLIARWWAEFNTEGEDIAWFQRLVEAGAGPALDLGCGTGRLLVPFVSAGLDVEGCDLSPDMLAYCRTRAEHAGLRPRLFSQPMHALDVDRSYSTIFICGSFGISASRRHDLDTLRSAHRHLKPGGTLAFDLFLPNQGEKSWQYWLPQHRPTLPSPWPEHGDRRVAADGSELELEARLLAFDPFEQVLTREIRATHRVEGEIVAQEQYALDINIYFKNEVELMLERAGFRDFTILDGLTDRPAKAYQSAHLMFVATK
jgi:SAM-dependent methyltransferase